MVVYVLINRVNGKRYVGITDGTVERRWQLHKSAARRGSDQLISRAIRKHGEDAFEVVSVEQCLTREHLCEREARWIVVLRSSVSEHGYNVAPGGDATNVGWHHTDETRARMSAARTGRKLGPRSDETKAKISAANAGRKNTPEQSARQSAAQMGREMPSMSEEQKAKLAEACSGWKHTDEARAKISAAQIGVSRKMPDDIGSRISAGKRRARMVREMVATTCPDQEWSRVSR